MSKYDYEFKLKVVMDYINEFDGYGNIAKNTIYQVTIRT